MQQQLLFPADRPYQVDSPELSEIRERVTAHPAACSRRELLAALGIRNPEQLDAVDLQFAQPLELGAAGASPREIASLVATTELARRFALAQVPDREPLLHPSAVARYLLLAFGVSDQEVMGALYVDVRHRLLQAKELFRGTLNRASVEPRALLKQGLLAGCRLALQSALTQSLWSSMARRMASP